MYEENASIDSTTVLFYWTNMVDATTLTISVVCKVVNFFLDLHVLRSSFERR